MNNYSSQQTKLSWRSIIDDEENNISVEIKVNQSCKLMPHSTTQIEPKWHLDNPKPKPNYRQPVRVRNMSLGHQKIVRDDCTTSIYRFLFLSFLLLHHPVIIPGVPSRVHLHVVLALPSRHIVVLCLLVFTQRVPLALERGPISFFPHELKLP